MSYTLDDLSVGDKVIMSSGGNLTLGIPYTILRCYTKNNDSFITLLNNYHVEEGYSVYRIKKVIAKVPNMYNYSDMELAVVHKIKQLDRKFEQRRSA